ncbi:low molecular weight protein-tyrosine-phosphatase [Winogradskyella sp. KYW1333]|uniref:low molecular weight protein-tyrosine-phosphatase n=1 Tax=unclassified Winogradskyella TaxID=2615021 RepID=UPI000DF1B7F1|nr:low molecular weight protein-tyrosine-phosphatase [Winogradskyella sp. KYW1333]RCT54465.1 low molecular weight phosphotyrosine protein phosphatase [Winogradskyella sp. KYW1333]
MTRILMVCLGNICRSPLAHGLLESKLNSQEYYVDSAGTASYHIGSQPDRRSIKVALNAGIDISAQRARAFTVKDFDEFDYIYAMDESNYADILRLSRNENDSKKVKLFLVANKSRFDKNVPDPYYGDMSDFECVFNLINETADLIVEGI